MNPYPERIDHTYTLEERQAEAKALKTRQVLTPRTLKNIASISLWKLRLDLQRSRRPRLYLPLHK